MICKNCSAEYDDSYSFCPSCGQRKEADITAGLSDEDVSFEEEYSAPVYELEEENEDVGEISGESITEEEAKPSEVKKTVKKKAPAKSAAPVSKSEKKAAMLVVVIMCVIAAASAVVAALNINTGTFEAKPQPQKAVALTKLSEEEEAVLEAELAQYFTVFRQNFDSAVSDAESFLTRINPADSGNIFPRLCALPLTPEKTADPAMRFADEYGEYTYYKIAATEIDKLLARFNLSSYGDINSKDFYYYDGYYYFGYIPTKTTPAVKAEILKSKKVLDGSFYVECYFYVENAGQTVKSNNCYLIVEKNDNAAFDGFSFRVRRSDISPLFTDGGNPTQINKSGDYTIESKVIEGRTDDGRIYSRYVIEYPVFSEKGAGIDVINQFYSGMLSSYEQKAASAQADYEAFISQGGNAQELPFTETVITRVTYTDDSRISCVEKIATYSPDIPVEQEETTTSQDEENGYYDRSYEDRFSGLPAEQEAEPAELFTRTVEAYTFDKATGDFVSKDAVLGKDYMVISEILYRIYNSYDYAAVIPEPEAQEPVTEALTDVFGDPVEEEEEYGYEDDYYGYDGYDDYRYEDEEEGYGDGVPEDEDGLGTEIYESACAFTSQGFTFWYVEEEGYVTAVTIPFDVIEKLVK